MKDFSQLLVNNIDTITQEWIAAVRQDEKIESARSLSHEALLDSLPRVLQAMATMLSQSQDSDVQSLLQVTLTHGLVRAEQHYEPTEIAREYGLVRWIIFSTLEAQLLKASPLEALRASRIIDTVIDEAIARCFQSYTDERLRELKQLQTQLQLTNQELRRFVRQSQENFSNLAYSLETPLNFVISYSDLFLQESADIRDNYPSLQHIEKVLSKGRQFLHLLNDTLEFVRYESGSLQLQPTQTNVKNAIDNVIETMAPLADTKKLTLIVECDRAPLQVLTDPLRLQQVLTNLLGQAICNTSTGTIKLICQLLSDTEWCIVVSDTGAGIPREKQACIFEPDFRLAASSESFLPTSTGLGMALVCRCVNLLQGTIELVSQVGIGSSFTVILPLSVQFTQKSITGSTS